MEKIWLFVLLLQEPSGSLVITTHVTSSRAECAARVDVERVKANPNAASYCVVSGAAVALDPKRPGV